MKPAQIDNLPGFIANLARQIDADPEATRLLKLHPWPLLVFSRLTDDLQWVRLVAPGARLVHPLKPADVRAIADVIARYNPLSAEWLTIPEPGKMVVLGCNGWLLVQQDRDGLQAVGR